MRKDSKKTLQITVIAVFFLFIIIYAFWGSHNLIFGVKIKNVNIADGVPARTTVQSGGKVSNSVIEIRGNANNATNLTLNGREISINQAGDFNETIALLAGYNIINITAKDKFGYVDKKDYKIVY